MPRVSRWALLLKELVLRRGLCSAAGRELGVSPEEAPSPPGPSARVGRGQRAGMALAAAGASALHGIVPRAEVLVSLRRLVRHAGGCPSSPVASPELQRGRGAALKAGTKQQKESGFLFSPVTHLSLISLGVSLQILQILRQMLSSPRLSSPRRLPSSELPAAGAEERENTNPTNSPTNNPRPTSITSGKVEALGAFTGVPSLCAAAGDDRFCGS